MRPLTHDDLLSLEDYARQRAGFRARVMAHKRDRTIHVGEHVTLLFEDRLTIQYQVQEMLRAERIIEAEGIAGELAAYNPLVPDGRNLKCTMLIEYVDVGERKWKLHELRGIEQCVAIEVAGHQPVIAVADEDLPRSNEKKTSAVHFLRFEFDDAMAAAARAGAAVTARIDHPSYAASAVLSDAQRVSLAADFD
ncbi:MAG: DUF3501 family protein [Lysobacterales bacterium]